MYVIAPNCHFCDEGSRIVERLATETGLQIERVDWGAPRAHELAERDRPMFPPALYLGSTLLGYGRLSERRLRKLIHRAAA